MNIARLILLGAGIVPVLAVSLPLYAAETDPLAVEHLAKAAIYEEKAKAQDTLIAEHQIEKKEAKAKYFFKEQESPRSKLKTFEKHCDRVIESASRLRTELLDLAKWHRDQAGELKGP